MGISDKTEREKRARGIKIWNKGSKAKAAAHKASSARYKTGTHPQMWRVTKHNKAGSKLGPMGPLGDDVVIEVRLKYDIYKVVPDISQQYLIGTLGSRVQEPLLDELYTKLNIWVPKDTGALRRSIRSRMDNSTASLKQISTTKPWRMVIGTPDIEYAKPVNKMPADWLKHKPQPSRFPGFTMDDPAAVKGWYDWLLRDGRRKAQNLFRDYLKGTIEPIIKKAAPLLGIKNVINFTKGIFIVKYK